MLYQKISKKGKEKNAMNTEFAVSRMLVMAKVLYGLHLVSVADCYSIPLPYPTYLTLTCLTLPAMNKTEFAVSRMLVMAKVLYGLHLVSVAD